MHKVYQIHQKPNQKISIDMGKKKLKIQLYGMMMINNNKKKKIKIKLKFKINFFMLPKILNSEEKDNNKKIMISFGNFQIQQKLSKITVNMIGDVSPLKQVQQLMSISVEVD
jgi:hypothetical protein